MEGVLRLLFDLLSSPCLARPPPMPRVITCRDTDSKGVLDGPLRSHWFEILFVSPRTPGRRPPAVEYLDHGWSLVYDGHEVTL